MSIFSDMRYLYQKYGMFDEPMTKAKFQFRMKLLDEEMSEIKESIKNKDSEELVDGLIDLIVIASGTLELCEVNGDEAWDEVRRANLSKKRGVKSTRPDSGGFDLIKPEGWKKPSHENNHGILDGLL